jgi:Cysteine rich repeat
MTTRIAITSYLFIGVAILLLPCSMVVAAELMEVARACVSDVKTQCPGVKPGEGRIRECIKTHLKDLSEPCQTVVLKAVKVKECATDVKQDCADKSGAALMACMKTHLADASGPCQEVLAGAAVGKN